MNGCRGRTTPVTRAERARKERLERRLAEVEEMISDCEAALVHRHIERLVSTVERCLALLERRRQEDLRTT
jgi:hypothetical protein